MRTFRPIHTDHNGVETRAITSDDGQDTDGHRYLVIHGRNHTTLSFQNGPIKEAGVNGLTNEALIAVLVHRLQFLNGKFPCRENALAITKLQEAGMWLDQRTMDRILRGVEGEHKA
jgi:hypothetical protein